MFKWPAHLMCDFKNHDNHIAPLFFVVYVKNHPNFSVCIIPRTIKKVNDF